MKMDIRDIMAVVGIFHHFLWYCFLFVTLPLSFLKTTILQRVANNHIVLLVLHAGSFHPIASIKSRWQELSCRNELSCCINTSCLWRKSMQTICGLFVVFYFYLFFFQRFVFTLWLKPRHRCRWIIIFHQRQHFGKMLCSDSAEACHTLFNIWLRKAART